MMAANTERPITRVPTQNNHGKSERRLTAERAVLKRAQERDQFANDGYGAFTPLIRRIR